MKTLKGRPIGLNARMNEEQMLQRLEHNAQAWQQLLQEALPVVDYTFNMVTSELDLSTARDKSLAAEKLLPIIAEMKNPVRRGHYLQKLARLVKVSERNLESALSRIKRDRTVGEPKPEAVAQALHPVTYSPIEEYCLALLLQHPELKAHCQDLSPEYFENSENREIFFAWQKANDLPSLKEELDITVHEHLERLINKSLLNAHIEQRYNDCVLRLREEHFKSSERKREAIFALEAETKGSGADVAKLKEEGIEPSIQLGEVFAQKRQSQSGAKE